MNKKIKICHFADHLTGKADGVFTHILLLLKYTDKDLFEHYLCFQGDERIETRFAEAGGKTIILPKLNKKIPLLATYFFIKTLREQKYTIVHTHFLKPYIISSLLKTVFHYKVIYNYHGLFIKNEYYNWLQTKIYQVAHWFVCKLGLVDMALVPSYYSKYTLQKETKLFSQIEVYYDCGEIDKSKKNNFPPSSLIKSAPNNKIFIGLISRLEHEKRIDLALSILGKCLSTFKDIHFFICGNGTLLNQLLQYSEELGIKEKVTFLGYIENINAFLDLFDIILVTSDREGLPMVVWEAMAAGVPIVSTDVGGIKEIIDNEKCGLLFEKGNLTEGVEKVSMLIQNPQLCKMLGENGKKAIMEKYNAQSFRNQMTRLYNNLVADI
jgi:glycosyltransferase involved in cell wall biosynthesis